MEYAAFYENLKQFYFKSFVRQTPITVGDKAIKRNATLIL